MTNLPSREELEQAIHDHGGAVGDDIEVAWDVIQTLLDRIYDPKLIDPLTIQRSKLAITLGMAIENLTDLKARVVEDLVMGGVPMTVNEVRTRILNWPPLPPGDHRGNSLLRNDPNG